MINKIIFLIAAFFIVPNLIRAQEKFPRKDLMPIGAYYYPEQWPKNQWERDLKNMADMGMEFTHVAEFAWYFLEPEEGKYNFGWLDTVVNLAAKYKLKVIMCTPSAAPPVWISKKYPETLKVDEYGKLYPHGIRQQSSYASTKYREFVRKINTELAKRYGNDPRIWGWQIDNEPKVSGTDYNPENQQRFRNWLKQKYGTIDSLNRAWGNAFWSWTYFDFSQVSVPNDAAQNGGNPHHIIDYKAYESELVADYLIDQEQTLRKYISKNQWVTSNYIASLTTTNNWLTAKNFDLHCITMYPVYGANHLSTDEQFRRADPIDIAWYHDYGMGPNGKLCVMELQPGQVNWAARNPLLYPNTVRLWLWHAFAAGNKFVCTYRYRQPNFNSEQYHDGLVGLDGVTPTRGGIEFSQTANEMKLLRKSLPKKFLDIPTEMAKTKTAILWDYTSLWNMEDQPQTVNFNAKRHINNYYKAAKELGASVSVINAPKSVNEIKQYPFVIVPAYQNVEPAEIKAWTEYAEQGGNLIISIRTGHKDKRGWLWEALHAQPIYNLIGAEITGFDHLAPHLPGKVKYNNTDYDWKSWGDLLKPLAGTEVWANYATEFYSGTPAVIHRKLGKGTVTYIGVETIDYQMEKEILRKIYESKVGKLNPLPKGILKYYRDGFWVLLNYSGAEYKYNLPPKAKVLLGNPLVKPADVLIWTE